MYVMLHNVVLAGGDAMSATSGAQLSLENTVDVQPITRAASPKVFDRGNWAVQLPFNVSRRFTDYQAAVEWQFSHAVELRALSAIEGKLCEVQFTSDSGATSVYYMVDAAVKSARVSRIMGATIFIGYLVVASYVTRSKP